MVKYKVWVHVEKIDEDEDGGCYGDVTLPDSTGGEFATLDEAMDKMTEVVDYGNLP